MIALPMKNLIKLFGCLFPWSDLVARYRDYDSDLFRRGLS